MDVETIAYLRRDRPGRVTGALHALQEELGYLEEGALRRLAAALGVPLSQIYGVATFYPAFRLRPMGRSHIQVCHGTACHVRGAVQLTEKLKRDLEVGAGETTPDGRFSLEEVRCLGCCGLAPVVKLNDVIHGRLNQTRLERLLRSSEKSDEGAEQG